MSVMEVFNHVKKAKESTKRTDRKKELGIAIDLLAKVVNDNGSIIPSALATSNYSSSGAENSNYYNNNGNNQTRLDGNDADMRTLIKVYAKILNMIREWVFEGGETAKNKPGNNLEDGVEILVLNILKHLSKIETKHTPTIRKYMHVDSKVFVGIIKGSISLFDSPSITIQNRKGLFKIIDSIIDNPHALNATSDTKVIESILTECTKYLQNEIQDNETRDKATTDMVGIVSNVIFLIFRNLSLNFEIKKSNLEDFFDLCKTWFLLPEDFIDKHHISTNRFLEIQSSIYDSEAGVELVPTFTYFSMSTLTFCKTIILSGDISEDVKPSLNKTTVFHRWSIKYIHSVLKLFGKWSVLYGYKPGEIMPKLSELLQLNKLTRSLFRRSEQYIDPLIKLSIDHLSTHRGFEAIDLSGWLKDDQVPSVYVSLLADLFYYQHHSAFIGISNDNLSNGKEEKISKSYFLSQLMPKLKGIDQDQQPLSSGIHSLVSSTTLQSDLSLSSYDSLQMIEQKRFRTSRRVYSLILLHSTARLHPFDGPHRWYTDIFKNGNNNKRIEEESNLLSILIQILHERVPTLMNFLTKSATSLVLRPAKNMDQTALAEIFWCLRCLLPLSLSFKEYQYAKYWDKVWHMIIHEIFPSTLQQQLPGSVIAAPTSSSTGTQVVLNNNHPGRSSTSNLILRIASAILSQRLVSTSPEALGIRRIFSLPMFIDPITLYNQNAEQVDLGMEKGGEEIDIPQSNAVIALEPSILELLAQLLVHCQSDSNETSILSIDEISHFEVLDKKKILLERITKNANFVEKRVLTFLLSWAVEYFIEPVNNQNSLVFKVFQQSLTVIARTLAVMLFSNQSGLSGLSYVYFDLPSTFEASSLSSYAAKHNLNEKLAKTRNSVSRMHIIEFFEIVSSIVISDRNVKVEAGKEFANFLYQVLSFEIIDNNQTDVVIQSKLKLIECLKLIVLKKGFLSQITPVEKLQFYSFICCHLSLSEREMEIYNTEANNLMSSILNVSNSKRARSEPQEEGDEDMEQGVVDIEISEEEDMEFDQDSNAKAKTSSAKSKSVQNAPIISNKRDDEIEATFESFDGPSAALSTSRKKQRKAYSLNDSMPSSGSVISSMLHRISPSLASNIQSIPYIHKISWKINVQEEEEMEILHKVVPSSMVLLSSENGQKHLKAFFETVSKSCTDSSLPISVLLAILLSFDSYLFAKNLGNNKVLLSLKQSSLKLFMVSKLLDIIKRYDFKDLNALDLVVSEFNSLFKSQCENISTVVFENARVIDALIDDYFISSSKDGKFTISRSLDGIFIGSSARNSILESIISIYASINENSSRLDDDEKAKVENICSTSHKLILSTAIRDAKSIQVREFASKSLRKIITQQEAIDTFIECLENLSNLKVKNIQSLYEDIDIFLLKRKSIDFGKLDIDIAESNVADEVESINIIYEVDRTRTNLLILKDLANSFPDMLRSILFRICVIYSAIETSSQSSESMEHSSANTSPQLHSLSNLKYFIKYLLNDIREKQYGPGSTMQEILTFHAVFLFFSWFKHTEIGIDKFPFDLFFPDIKQDSSRMQDARSFFLYQIFIGSLFSRKIVSEEEIEQQLKQIKISLHIEGSNIISPEFLGLLLGYLQPISVLIDPYTLQQYIINQAQKCLKYSQDIKSGRGTSNASTQATLRDIATSFVEAIVDLCCIEGGGFSEWRDIDITIKSINNWISEASNDYFVQLETIYGKSISPIPSLIDTLDLFLHLTSTFRRAKSNRSRGKILVCIDYWYSKLSVKQLQEDGSYQKILYTLLEFLISKRSDKEMSTNEEKTSKDISSFLGKMARKWLEDLYPNYFNDIQKLLKEKGEARTPDKKSLIYTLRMVKVLMPDIYFSDFLDSITDTVEIQKKTFLKEKYFEFFGELLQSRSKTTEIKEINQLSPSFIFDDLTYFLDLIGYFDDSNWETKIHYSFQITSHMCLYALRYLFESIKLFQIYFYYNCGQVTNELSDVNKRELLSVATTVLTRLCSEFVDDSVQQQSSLCLSEMLFLYHGPGKNLTKIVSSNDQQQHQIYTQKVISASLIPASLVLMLNHENELYARCAFEALKITKFWVDHGSSDILLSEAKMQEKVRKYFSLANRLRKTTGDQKLLDLEKSSSLLLSSSILAYHNSEPFADWVKSVSFQLCKRLQESSRFYLCAPICILDFHFSSLIFPALINEALTDPNIDKCAVDWGSKSGKDMISKSIREILLETDVRPDDQDQKSVCQLLLHTISYLRQTRITTWMEASKQNPIDYNHCGLDISFEEIAIAASKFDMPFTCIQASEFCLKSDIKKISPTSLQVKKSDIFNFLADSYRKIGDTENIGCIPNEPSLFNCINARVDENKWFDVLMMSNRYLQSYHLSEWSEDIKATDNTKIGRNAISLNSAMTQSMRKLGLNHLLDHFQLGIKSMISEHKGTSVNDIISDALLSLNGNGILDASSIQHEIKNMIGTIANQMEPTRKDVSSLLVDLKRMFELKQALSSREAGPIKSGDEYLSSIRYWNAQTKLSTLHFDDVDPIFSAREMIAKSLLNSSSDERLSHYLNEHLIDSIEFARSNHKLPAAIIFVEKLKEVNSTQSKSYSKVVDYRRQLLESQILWEFGDQDMSFRTLEKLDEQLKANSKANIRNTNDVAHSLMLAEVLCYTGACASQRLSMDINMIRNNYFAEAIGALSKNEKIVSSLKGRALARSHRAMAKFVDQMFRGVDARKKSEEWKRYCEILDEREAVLAGLSAANDSTINKLKRELESDQKERKALDDSHNALLRETMVELAKSLMHSRARVQEELDDVTVIAFRACRADDDEDDDDEQAIFRFISLWLEYGDSDYPQLNSFIKDMLIGHPSSKSSGANQKSSSQETIPTYKFLKLVYQIASRLGEKAPSLEATQAFDENFNNDDDDFGNQDNISFSELIKKFVVKLAIDHPFHVIPQLLALMKGGSDDVRIDSEKAKAAKRVWEDLNDLSIREKRWFRNVIPEMEELSHALIAFSSIEIKDRTGTKNLSMSERLHMLSKKWSDEPKIRKLVPVPTYSIPIRPLCDYQQLLEINEIPHIEKFYEEFKVTEQGINSPKILSIRASNGRNSKILVKGKDDLRQDLVMEQVFSIVNSFLEKDKQSRSKKLSIRTYNVIPLNSTCGLVEWVEGAVSVGGYLYGGSGVDEFMKSAHARHNKGDLSYREALFKLAEYQKGKNKDRDEMIKKYQDVCSKFKPAFHHFFMEKFPLPRSWYEGRVSYTKSVATSSIVGYILGIGDRHSQNMMIDEQTAEVIHIDFGIVFDQGKLLPFPEIVPFRLTRDIVDGMGYFGVRGLFQRSCEDTLRVLRNNTDKLITICEVLLHDPLYKWTLTPLKVDRLRRDEESEPSTTFNSSRKARLQKDSRKELTANISREAERSLLRVQQKLQGYEDLYGNGLTIESQVQKLINQASDDANLCQMYYGWAPFL